MRKNIAIIAALVVVLGLFLSASGGKFGSPTTPLLPSLSSDLNVLTFNNIQATPVGILAWETFQNYLGFARAHDLEGLKSLSHQLSPACQDADRAEECEELMDSVVFFAEDFKQSDFTNIAYDDKQIVMHTDYLNLEGAQVPVKTVLYFTRVENQTKVLGIRFCLGEEDPQKLCVETDKDKRDSDKDGWWDDVEELFNK